MMGSLAATAGRVLLIAGLLALPACKGDDGRDGVNGKDATSSGELDPDAPLPGVNVTILGVGGASGADGTFQVGDFLTVRFQLTQDDGTPLVPADMSRGAIMVSGPTFNYQIVLDAQRDLFDRATGSKTLSYTFPMPIPKVYAPPPNDTPSLTDGELTGQPLLAGTYTVGIEARRDLTVDGESYRDVGNATLDFLLGGAKVIQRREVVSMANCNQCHVNLSAHGENRNDVRNCVLCHVAGAEDDNDPAIEGGTPGETVEFSVMIHKIHSGKNLAQVQGVTTKSDGSRDYTVPSRPYKLVGFNTADFSNIGWPEWPSLAYPMPRDVGYGALASADRAKEDAMRSQPSDCNKCHGDPDGAGPLLPPAQGDLIYHQLTRRTCGSCHDDWVPTFPYTSNGQTMPAQPDDGACTVCHRESGDALSVRDAHLHPLLDPTVAGGVVFDLREVKESGTNDGDGSIDAGEGVRIVFTVRDRAGNDIDPTTLSGFTTLINGPTTNPNMVHYMTFPAAKLGAGPLYQPNLPERLDLEFLGTSTAAGSEVFQTMRAPHWNVSGANTSVFSRTATGASSVLAQPAPAYQNFVDVTMGDGVKFARDDYIAVDDGDPGLIEYMRVQFVDGDRLWFSSVATSAYPAQLRKAHAAGMSVSVVTLTALTENVDYSLNTTTGVIQELNEFGNGNHVVVTYTTDFVMPTHYMGGINESPDLDQHQGDWVGLPLAAGTYTFGIFANLSMTVSPFGETTTYRDASQPATLDFLVGGATSLSPNGRISSSASCYACHNDIQFHGGNRRGYETCILCHGISGGEDRPRYVAANALATPDTNIDFRSMLHKIHHGVELAQGANYIVNGFGQGYPNNFTPHTYEHVGFPAMPEGTKDCRACHGQDNTAWQQPSDRAHPLGQMTPDGTWKVTCNSCHDSNAATAHMDANTAPSGAESCEICHGPGEEFEVQRVHFLR